MKKEKLRRMLLISLFAAVISICSMISIPFPIPFTLQTLGIFTALIALGGRDGFASVILYIAIGIMGIPVFAGFGSGIGYLLGASGGFILGFIPGAAAYALMEVAFGRYGRRRIVYLSASQLIIYLCGCLWFAHVYGGADSLASAFLIGCAPFIIPDMIKLILAYFVAEKLRFKVNFTA